MTAGDFDALFDRFTTSVVRLEALPVYDVGGAEAERIVAWRAGEPRPVRSVRTSLWLARIATSTVSGKTWRRVRVVDEPLSEYQCYQLDGYLEAQAVGEDILIAARSAAAAFGDIGPDVWVFDGDQPGAYAAVMRYDGAGQWLGFELVEDPDEVAVYAARVERIARLTVPLNSYLAYGAARGVRRG